MTATVCATERPATPFLGKELTISNSQSVGSRADLLLGRKGRNARLRLCCQSILWLLSSVYMRARDSTQARRSQGELSLGN